MKKTEALESDRSVSKSCLCPSLPGSKSYVGRVALDKLQKLIKPQFAHLQNGKEHSVPSQYGCEAEGENCQAISRELVFCVYNKQHELLLISSVSADKTPGLQCSHEG